MENSGLKDLRNWVEHNTDRFEAEHYTKDDIENLAIACGFSRIAVAQWKTFVLFKDALR